MSDDLDLAQITAVGDRRFTVRLLELLERADDSADLDPLVGALRAVRDSRAVDRLWALIQDEARPARLRRAAADALFDDLVTPSPAWIRSAFAAGGVLRDVAVRWSDQAFAAEFLAWLSEPGRDVQDAGSTDWDGRYSAGFAELRARWITAPDPDRRLFAVEEAYWNEPHDLLPALCRALVDPDPEVATEAARALVYQPSVQAFQALCVVRRSDEAHAEIDAARAEMGPDLVGWPPDRAVGDGGAWLARWLAPIADRLPIATGLAPPAAPPTTSKGVPPDLAALAARLDEPDAETMAELLRHTVWVPPADIAAVPVRDRIRWIRRFIEHPDPVVRQAGGRWCGIWQDADALTALAGDPHVGVQKFAVYALRELPPHAPLAELAWSAVLRPGTANAAMYEAIESWFHHAPADPTRVERLVGLRSSASLAARCRALDLLTDLGALDRIDPCWTPRPGESVADVCAWLRACRAVGRPVEVPAETWALDNLWVQLELVDGLTAGCWTSPA